MAIIKNKQQEIFNNSESKENLIFESENEPVEQTDAVNLEKLINDACDVYTQTTGDTYEKYFKRIVVSVANRTADVIKHTDKIRIDSRNKLLKYGNDIITCTNNDPNGLTNNYYRFYDPHAVVIGVFAGFMLNLNPVKYNKLINIDSVFRSLGLSENELINNFKRCGGGVIYKKYMVYHMLIDSGAYENDTYTEQEINLLMEYLREREI